MGQFLPLSFGLFRNPIKDMTSYVTPHQKNQDCYVSNGYCKWWESRIKYMMPSDSDLETFSHEFKRPVLEPSHSVLPSVKLARTVLLEFLPKLQHFFFSKQAKLQHLFAFNLYLFANWWQVPRTCAAPKFWASQHMIMDKIMMLCPTST